jgi:hypothetical protein
MHEAKIEYLNVLINMWRLLEKKAQNISACSMEFLRRVFDTNYFGTIQTTYGTIRIRLFKTPVDLLKRNKINSGRRQTYRKISNFKFGLCYW